MNLTHFNAALAVGWLLVSGGAFLFGAGVGCLVAGALLIALTLIVARTFGVFGQPAKQPEDAA